MKRPAPKRPLGQPPHPLAGYYRDSTGSLFYVPSKPAFALFRLDANSEILNPNSPLQDDPAKFAAAVGFGTFTRINH